MTIKREKQKTNKSPDFHKPGLRANVTNLKFLYHELLAFGKPKHKQ